MDDPERRVALIEQLDRDGRCLRSIDVPGWPLTIGRALDNVVVLDDPHVAPNHARLEPDAHGKLTLTVIDSVNGMRLDGRSLPADRPTTMDRGGRLQLGQTQLRLRLRDDPVPEVQRLLISSDPRIPPSARLALICGLMLVAVQLASQWLGLDPGADYSAWLPTLVAIPVALVIWAGLWALGSKLFQNRFDFSGHLRIALPWLLLMTVVEMGLPLVAASLGAPWLWRASSLLQGLLVALLMYGHLAHVLPQHERVVGIAVAVLALAGGGLSAAVNYRGTDSLSAAPYMSTLPLPGLRLHGASSGPALVRDMAPLAEQLAARVKKAKDNEEGDNDEAASGE